MKEIKFRAWNRECKFMDSVWCIDIEHDEVCFSNHNAAALSVCDVMQYIGLKDKNGKEIFEGDILQVVMDNGITTLLTCKFGTVNRKLLKDVVAITGFYFERAWDRKATYPIVSNYIGKSDLEILEAIGNIYENPNLLESEATK